MRKLLKALPLLAALILSAGAAGAPPKPLPAPKPVAVPRSAPMAVPIVQTLPDAADVAYPGGTIALDIDASDTARGAFRVTETIPLAAGTRELTLLLPRWNPGQHGPRGSTHVFGFGQASGMAARSGRGKRLSPDAARRRA
jgi:hypothetical protein